MKNLFSPVFAVVLGVASLFRRQLRLIITVDGITHITTEAITTNITTEAITTDIAITGTTIGSGPGLSASMGVQGIRYW